MEVLLKQVSVGPCPLTLNTSAAELWLQAYQLLIPQSAGAQQQTSRYCCRLTGQTDGRMDTPLHRPCSAYAASVNNYIYCISTFSGCGSVAEWLACWTQALKGLGSNCSRNAVG